MRFVPLLAALEDWIKVVVPLVVFTIISLNRLFGGEAARKKMQQQRRAGPVAPPQPPQPQGERQRVEDEVAEFLRRATQTKEGRPAAPPSPPKQSRKAQQAAAPVRRLTPKRDVNAPLYDNEPTQARAPAAPATPSTAKRVEAPRPSEIEQADEAMELQIHQALDHQVGSQVGSLAGTAPTATSDQRAVRDVDSPISIGELLRDPRSIRDAIVVSEILRRPTERW
jgi:hypothetical protein